MENMSYRKLAGNNLDKYLHFTLTNRIGLKIKKADNENEKKLSKISSVDNNRPKLTQLTKSLDKI